MKNLILIVVLALCAIPVMAQQEHTFSFASDSAPKDWTFRGSAGNSIASEVVVDFMTDLNEINTGGTVTFLANHKMDAFTYDYQVFPCGSNYLHVWKVAGTVLVEHNSAPGNPGILYLQFENAVLTAISPSKTRIYDSMTLHVNEESEPNLLFQPLNVLNGLGVFPANLDRSENFAYTFTDIRNAFGGSSVALDPGSGEFLEDWFSEGSFSASAE